MEQANKQPLDRKALVDAAFAIVFTNENKFLREVAEEYTLANMGQTIDDFVTEWTSLENLVTQAYGQFYIDVGVNRRDLTNEYTSWLKEAKKIVKALKKAELPLTVHNAHHFWDKTGPFASK